MFTKKQIFLDQILLFKLNSSKIRQLLYLTCFDKFLFAIKLLVYYEKKDV